MLEPEIPPPASPCEIALNLVKLLSSNMISHDHHFSDYLRRPLMSRTELNRRTLWAGTQEELCASAIGKVETLLNSGSTTQSDSDKLTTASNDLKRLHPRIQQLSEEYRPLWIAWLARDEREKREKEEEANRRTQDVEERQLQLQFGGEGEQSHVRRMSM